MIYIFVTLLIYLILIPYFNIEVWGLKTTSSMDVWTIEHLLSGISVGYFVKINNEKILKKFPELKIPDVFMEYLDIVGVLFFAYFWETTEHYLETGIAGQRVMDWFQGVEYWQNRIIFDPLMLILGYSIAIKFPKLVNPARVCSVIWIAVHIFIFPHSMYLHELYKLVTKG